MTNQEKVVRLLKEFKQSDSTDYEWWAEEIEGVFTGWIPTNHFIVDKDNTTLDQIMKEVKVKTN